MEILNYTEQHEKYREQFKVFMEKEILPHADDWEKDHLTPKKAWKTMGAAGFLCPWLSKEYGGMGGDLLHSIVVNKELSRSNHTGLMAYLHSDIVVPYIDTFGSEAQKKKYLPGCASGDVLVAIAMTEPDHGSDLASMSMTAEQEGEQIVLNGTKTYISIGLHCDLVIVAAKDPAVDNPHKSISLYLVEDGTPGFTRGSKLEKMGMQSQDTAELFFSNCKIPRENILGEKGQGFVMLMKKLQQERLMVALYASYSAKFILKWLKNYFKKKAPAKLTQSTQFALAEIAADITVATTFLDKLVADHMEKKHIVMETSMAKFWVTDLTKKIAGRALDLIGSDGLRQDCPISRTWRDVQVYSIFAGTNEIMKTIISKQMLA